MAAATLRGRPPRSRPRPHDVSGFSRDGRRRAALRRRAARGGGGRAHGTPLYVYSRAAIAEAYRAYEPRLRARARTASATRSRPTARAPAAPPGRRWARAPTSSPGCELQAALRAGFPPERIVFSGVGKTDEEIAAAPGGGHRRVQRRERGRDRALVGAGRRPRAAGRPVTPARQPRHRRALASVHLDRPARQQVRRRHRAPRPASWGARARLPGDRDRAACSATSARRSATSSRCGEAAARAGRAVAHAARPRASRCARSTSAAGWASTTRSGDRPRRGRASRTRVLPPLRELPLTRAARARPVAGGAARACCSRASSYVKENHGKRFVIVDAGMNDLLRPALYKAHHRIEPVRGARPRRAAGRRGGARLRDRGLPGPRPRAGAAVSPATLLAVRDAGAYGFAMASNYNMRPRPAEVMDRGRPAAARSAGARRSRTWSSTEV